MKTSIITAVYNGVAHIEDTILSVLSQDYADIEYIVVDGGSTDGTMEVINKYRSKISVVISEPDKGLYDALNKGVAIATGDIIGLLHADDIYTNPKVISKVVNAFYMKGCDTIYSDLLYVDAQDTEKIVRYWQSEPYMKDAFLKGWMPPHPTFFVKKEVYEKYGRFNTTMRISADYELMLRLLYKHNVSTSYLPEVTIKMRIGGISNASLLSRWKANMEDRLAWRINNLKPYFYTLYVKPLTKVTQYFKKPPIQLTQDDYSLTVK